MVQCDDKSQTYRKAINSSNTFILGKCIIKIQYYMHYVDSTSSSNFVEIKYFMFFPYPNHITYLLSFCLLVIELVLLGLCCLLPLYFLYFI